ncbi:MULTISPECIES: hypothetical protein [Mycolicibacterium]|jgi:hypothetical protein|uniref:hypothetical protein n=1 Tax=Mycolicibacterium TaxID=1866885 RepID=UPI000662ADBF|nr:MULTISPECIES: hypothetical protein [Mycolicibacterium]
MHRSEESPQVPVMLLVPLHMHRGVHRDIPSRGVSAGVHTGPMPTSEQRDRRAADLRERAALVRAYGWEPYENVWSSGEVAGVRAVLGEPGALDAAVEAWAPTLWGAAASEADARTGYSSTRRWFLTLQGVAALDVLHAAAGKVASCSRFHSLDEARPQP